MYLITRATIMPLNILVTGANGQLGSELHYLSQNELLLCKDIQFFFTNRNTLDISSKPSMEHFCEKNAITHIINCAAYTAVDKAESDSTQADVINHLAIKYIAEVAKEQNIAVIHISTDYVFDGKNYKPYNELDTPNPQSVYGKTKLLGEKAMQFINPANSIIIRTAWVYSSFGNNFVKTMLRLGKERSELGIVSDQIGSPTYARDLAKAIITILPQLNNDNVEVFHYTNEGICSWFDFAKSIFEIGHIHCNAKPITTNDYPTPAQRPHYSVLNKQQIKDTYIVDIPYWKDSLQNCLSILLDKTS